MDFWSESVKQSIREWDRSIPLLLIGPTGVGKSSCIDTLFKDHQIICYQSSAFRDTKKFLEDIRNTLFHKSILAAFSVSTPKAMVIENIDGLTSTEKAIIRFLANINNPITPVILTARKPEKRHREIMRSCHVVKITGLDPDCGYFNESQKARIKAGETNLRSILKDKERQVHVSEDISVLSCQILRGEITKIPDTLSLTEKYIMVNTIIENLGDRVNTRLRLLADRSFAKIFVEERWDLIRVIDSCVLPNIIEEITINGPVKKPTFSILLSRISTRALNRKTLVSVRDGVVNNPIVNLYEKIDSLPDRFRVKRLFTKD
jgi:hypothetical protein